jgi:hypothetical protein
MDKCPKFGRAIYQEWQMHFDLIWFGLDSLFHHPFYLCIFLGSGHFGGRDILEILTPSAGTNN